MDPDTSVTRISRQSAARLARERKTGCSGMTWTVPSGPRRAVARLARSVRGRSSPPPGRRLGRGRTAPCSAGRSCVASSRVSASTRRRTSGRRAASCASGSPPACWSTVRSRSTEGRTTSGLSSAITSLRPDAAAAASTSSRMPGPNRAASSSDHSRTPGYEASRPPPSRRRGPVRSPLLPSPRPLPYSSSSAVANAEAECGS